MISPWNFPLALTFGMATAALVAGNTLVVKPASTSPTSVYLFTQMLQDLGLPPGVLNLVTGSGGVVGNALVDHPRTRFVAFTGSMEVGVGIHERAAKISSGQVWIKRTVLEMGGKNAVVVDREADLDAAAEGVVTSAFSFQGQKCSAGSRAIIDEAIYDEFVDKLVDGAKRLQVGNPTEVSVDLGPVIDKTAFESILEFIEIGKKEGNLLLGGDREEGEGYFIQPTIIADVSPDATIAQEEIFGPVLACIKAKDYDDALRNRQRHEVWSDRLGLQPPTERSWNEPGASSTLATFTSIVSRRVLSWGFIPLAASTCPARIPRRAGLTTCFCFRKARRLAKKIS